MICTALGELTQHCMSVREGDDERRDRVSHPGRMCGFDGHCLQGHYQSNSPGLNSKPDEEPLIGSLGEPGPEK